MQVPRDLSRRMLEAAEKVPAIDIHERLVPESRRINERCDFIAWILAYAGAEMHALGVKPEELVLLGDIQADPEERWALMSLYWPHLRTTSAGRTVLRVAWELFDVEEIDERTWKDISARLWKSSERGFYQEYLCRRANIRTTLVDGPVDSEMLPFCAPIRNYDSLLAIRCQADIEALEQELGGSATTLEQLEALLGKSVQQDVDRGYVAFKLATFPDFSVGWTCAPSFEEVEWAYDRVWRRDDSSAPLEPALHSYLGHRFLTQVSRLGLPVLIDMGGHDAGGWRRFVPYETPSEGPAPADDRLTTGRPEPLEAYGPISPRQLGCLARQYPRVRFVALYTSGLDATVSGGPMVPMGSGTWKSASLLALARTLPNVLLALGDIWQVSPLLARQSLRMWLQGVPLRKLFALAGNTTMVEAACVQALFVREQIGALLAEMVADGDLDEDDAHIVMQRLLIQNVQDHFGL